MKSGEMLAGEYSHRVGEKDRTALPKAFREQIGPKIIITRGYEGSLIIVSPRQWEGIVAEAASGPFVSRAVRDTSRFLLGGAREVELDEQGRFVIPRSLMEYAGIKDEVCFLGLGRWAELWDKGRWEKRRDYLARKGGDIAEKLAKVEV